jgi:chromosome segregation ATPase
MPAEQENILEQLNTARQQVTALTGERDAARGQVNQLTTDLTAVRGQVTQLTSERDTARGQITQLTTDRDGANTRLTAAQADVTRLTASQANFDQRLATELAKHGVRATAPAAEALGGGAKTLSLTEQCMAQTQGKDQINRA